MYDFGPKNEIKVWNEISNESLYGNIPKDEILSMCEPIESRNEKFPDRVAYYIDDKFSIITIKIGHGWSGYSQRVAYLEDKTSTFSRWEYKERSINLRLVYASYEDAKTVLLQKLQKMYIDITKNIYEIKSKLNNIKKSDFRYSIDDDFNITISNDGNYNNCGISDEVKEQIIEVYKDKLSDEMANLSEKLEGINYTIRSL